ncbi:uncharacterized protein LOC117809317 [Xyrichtys novacula]|uniref:Uncharacterized protein LOC117809317 n=1 Tax=Xyrichtys novacula TaxID=13765 RepID=A0AAV1HE03_XYRNO|nr:uncharacterized protein LOC117809317 [Xyrichtys novacula]
MNVLQTLIFSVLTALLDAQTVYYTTALEGGDTKIHCLTSEANERKFFCREDCKQNDTLVETLGVSAQSDRYSIEWERRGQSSVGDVFIKISQLKKSDSGQYTCGVGPLTSATYDYNEIVVVDAELSGGKRETPTISAKSGGDVRISCPFSSSFHQLRISAFLCRVETLQCLFVPTKVTGNTRQHDRYTIRYVQYTSGSGFVYVSISQLKKSDSGRYRCGLERQGLSDIWSVFDVDVSDEPTVETQTSAPENSKPGTTPSKPAAPPKTTLRSTTDTLLYVGLTLVVLLGLFLLVLLIFYKRKSSKPKERQENLQQAPEETSKRPKGIQTATKPNKTLNAQSKVHLNN